MGKKHFWLSLSERVKPFQKVVLTCMCAETVQGMNYSADLNLFSQDFNLLESIDKFSSQGSIALESDNNQMGCWIGQVEFEMMLDASPVAHPCASQNDARTAVIVELLGFFH